MWTVTKMTTGQWCEAIESEAYKGPLARLAVSGRLPSGVDVADPLVVERVWKCVYRVAILPHQHRGSRGAGPDAPGFGSGGEC